MTELLIRVEVPESRRVTITLPPDVPVGPAELSVRFEPVTAISVPLPEAVPACAFPPRPFHPKLAAEYDAFQQMLPELLKEHRGEYAAVHDGKVVGFGHDRAAVLTRAWQAAGNPMIYVERITDEPQALPRSGVVRRPANEKSG
jgi:hypothetical protein